jgi:hypothetical protein
MAGLLGATLLLAGMAALRWAPMSLDTWWFWVSASIVFAAVYWPNVYLSTLNQAYHQQVVARVFSMGG